MDLSTINTMKYLVGSEVPMAVGMKVAAVWVVVSSSQVVNVVTDCALGSGSNHCLILGVTAR
jgi:hypothetical protein